VKGWERKLQDGNQENKSAKKEEKKNGKKTKDPHN